MGWMTEQLWFNPQKWWQNFSSTKMPRTVLRPTSPLIQWVPVEWGLLPPWHNSQGMKLTTHLHLAPRLRMGGATSLFLHTLAWHALGHGHGLLPSPLAPTKYVGIRKIIPPQNYLAQDVWSWSGSWASFYRGVRIGKHSGLRCIRFKM